MKEDKKSWRNFLIELKGRDLNGVQLIIGDKNLGMLQSIHEVYPNAKYQRCKVLFYGNIFSVTPRSSMKFVAKMLKAIHVQERKKQLVKRQSRSLMSLGA